jgi:hypothetical protein
MKASMKSYIGTKIIRAEPMTRQAYNDLRGWTVPADENPSDAGYLVEYQDGGKPNVPGFAGYVSWSPKAQFEQAYVEIGSDADLKPHQLRMLGEKAEIDVKRIKLAAFLYSGTFAALEAAERERLEKQMRLMAGYSDVLAERIQAFAVIE